ncbi:MAG: VOC family protein [Fimbriimonadaceae bacterium]|nr:VOC family protein [Fimbriimonadaceae bacterium]QYK58592.1 MAG: VOC family protein [Fimbriimonadaceae bacterium]
MQPDAFITFLPVRDLARSSQYYRDKMGLTLALDQGSCQILRVSPGVFLGLCESATLSEPARVILTWVVDDVDAWHERLTIRGVLTDGRPRENPKFGIYHFFAEDPDGHRVEVQRFLDPRWTP